MPWIAHHLLLLAIVATYLAIALPLAIGVGTLIKWRLGELPTEEPEYEDDGMWQWPARRVGPVGRTRIEDRRIG